MPRADAVEAKSEERKTRPSEISDDKRDRAVGKSVKQRRHLNRPNGELNSSSVGNNADKSNNEPARNVSNAGNNNVNSNNRKVSNVSSAGNNSEIASVRIKSGYVPNSNARNRFVGLRSGNNVGRDSVMSSSDNLESAKNVGSNSVSSSRTPCAANSRNVIDVMEETVTIVIGITTGASVTGG